MTDHGPIDPQLDDGQTDTTGTDTTAADPAEPPRPSPAAESIDLDGIEADLREVESTLARLADGTYFAESDVPNGGSS